MFFVFIILLLIAIIAIQLVMFFVMLYQHKENGYIPSVSVSISKDGGKSFSPNILSLPSEGTLYIKYEVSVKTKGIYWLFFGTKINVTLNYPEVFTLVDYSGSLDKDKAKEYDISVSSAESTGNYHVAITPSQPVSENIFTVIASSTPKKTEIVLMLPEGKQFDQDKVQLSLQFNKPIAKAYNRTIVFTIPETRLKKDVPQ